MNKKNWGIHRTSTVRWWLTPTNNTNSPCGLGSKLWPISHTILCTSPRFCEWKTWKTPTTSPWRKTNLGGGWNQPIWKTCSLNWIIFPVKINKKWSFTTKEQSHPRYFLYIFCLSVGCFRLGLPLRCQCGTGSLHPLFNSLTWTKISESRCDITPHPGSWLILLGCPITSVIESL